MTKSGTNQWHGSAFEFIRNNYIDATNYFATGKDQLHQNQYGGTFGGRVIRDRLFFFGGYQRLSASVAPCRASVTGCAGQMADPSALLRSDAPVAAAGVAALKQLPCDGAGPVYMAHRGGELQRVLRWIALTITVPT